MIGLVLRLVSGPAQLLLACAACAALCGCLGCFGCMRCKKRDIAIVRWLLRFTGHDTYDEFVLLVMVHEASSEIGLSAKTFVKIRAGDQAAATAKCKRGIFQELLSILVEQGTSQLVIDLLAQGGTILATLKLDIVNDVLACDQTCVSSVIYNMNQKERGVLNPTVTLSLSAGKDTGGDMESGVLGQILDGEDTETAFMMKKHLASLQQDVATHDDMYESLRGVMSAATEADVERLRVLMKACSGPVDVFQRYGNSDKRYISVVGPPISRRFVLRMWKNVEDMDAGKPGEEEVDILKIENVQVDPGGRTDVFHISIFDSQHSYTGINKTTTITCKIVDRPAKVWVETMLLVIPMIRAIKKEQKKERESKTSKPSASSKSSKSSKHR